MLVDYAAEQLSVAKDQIGKLAKQESKLGRARSARDKEAQELRKQLLQQAGASLAYIYLAATGAADNDALRAVWQKDAVHVDAQASLRDWRIDRLYQTYWAHPTLDLTILPPYSFSICFQFTLAKPYLSRGDTSFYIVDNPLPRDKVLRLPVVQSSSWKGNLRSAMVRELAFRAGALDAERFAKERLDLSLLFGDEKGEGEDPLQGLADYLDRAKPQAAPLYHRQVRDHFRLPLEDAMPHHAGRLRFFPAFFTKSSLEIINPHERRDRVGTDPILFESVPAGAKGFFVLLYVPCDGVSLDTEEARRARVAQHLPLLARGLQAMFRQYGFSAKRTSGFGLAAEEVTGVGGQGEGSLLIHADAFREGPQPAEHAPGPAGPPSPPQGMEEFLVNGEFPIMDKGDLSKQSWGTKKVSRYKQVRGAYQAWIAAKKAWEEAQEPEAQQPAAQAPPPLKPQPFRSFAQLVQVADEAASSLGVGHE
jgi:CRISPR/Cas system CMR subunit Cmr6 (Cas7 group RAMP superfamily)